MSIEQNIERIATALEGILALAAGAAGAPVSIAPLVRRVEEPTHTERPTLSDTPSASKKAEPNPANAVVASGSTAEPSSVAAPDAATALTGDALLLEINRLVLQAVKSRALGSDDAASRAATVALLAKHGGQKVPLVPEANRAALLADLQAALG